MPLILQVKSRKIESSEYPQWSLGADESRLLMPNFFFLLFLLRLLFFIARLFSIYAVWGTMPGCYMVTKMLTHTHIHTHVVFAESTRARINYFSLLNIQFPNCSLLASFQLSHIRSILYFHLFKKNGNITICNRDRNNSGKNRKWSWNSWVTVWGRTGYFHHLKESSYKILINYKVKNSNMAVEKWRNVADTTLNRWWKLISVMGQIDIMCLLIWCAKNKGMNFEKILCIFGIL